MNKMIIPYGRQTILDEDIDAVVNVLKSDYLTQGPCIMEFEDKVAAYHGAKYAVSFANGTAALHAAYYATGISEGDEFITSPISFIATANGGLFLGAKPVFVDIDLETNCIDHEKIENKITEKTKVITPVSLAGYPVDLKSIRAIADRHNCMIIHDAAHAIGSKRDGTFGMEYADMAILSFHPVKHIATGEGGMVLTNSEVLNKRLRLFRTHGITKEMSDMTRFDGAWYYEMQDLGYNYRLSDISAALGISQFNRIDSNIRRRNEIAKQYDDAFEYIEELNAPPSFEYKECENIHSYHLYSLRIKNTTKRKVFFDYLRENGIQAQIHYIPITSQPYYIERFGTRTEDYPNANLYYDTEISIPMFHGMSDLQQEYVIDMIKKYIW